jgi:hypothetical protein
MHMIKKGQVELKNLSALNKVQSLFMFFSPHGYFSNVKEAIIVLMSLTIDS